MSGNLTALAVPLSSLAPAAIQARRSFFSSSVGCFDFLGGMTGLVFPSTSVTAKLSSGLPGMKPGKLMPPVRNFWYVETSRPPFGLVPWWHSRQYLDRNGLMSLAKLGGSAALLPVHTRIARTRHVVRMIPVRENHVASQ